jgi:hypothetical protein
VRAAWIQIRFALLWQLSKGLSVLLINQTAGDVFVRFFVAARRPIIYELLEREICVEMRVMYAHAVKN